SDLLLDVPSFLMPHHRHGHSLIRGEAPHDGRVVSKLPISMDFHQVSEEHLEVLQCVRALGVTGYLGLLPGGEAGVNLASEVLEFLPETLDLRSAIIAPRDPRHLLDALFQLLDGLLDVLVLKGQGIPPPVTHGDGNRGRYAAGAPGSRGCKSGWWRCRRAPASSGRPGDRHHAPAGGSRTSGVTRADSGGV